MSITYNAEKKLFRLVSPEMEYAFAINNYRVDTAPLVNKWGGELVNLHWGKPLFADGDYDLLLSDTEQVKTTLPHGYNPGEYRFCSPFDYAAPAIRVRFPDGAESLRLVYQSHEINGDTLEVLLADAYYPFEVKLIYKMFGDLPLISRSAVITNKTDGEVILRSAMSATLQLPRGERFRLTHFSGDWGAEYQRQETMLTNTQTVIETSYLTDAASHAEPFFALDHGMATETQGSVWFGALQYSGDFRVIVETKHTQQQLRTSVTLGINDFTSEIHLASGESFVTPTAIVGFSGGGFGRMSEILYDWQYDYALPRGKMTDKAHSSRPVVYNTWCPFTFSINEQKCLELIPKAKDIGIELFVIDDAWMKGRRNDRCGLGDWVMDPERFPHGLGYISDKVHEAGMKFGLWVEPEMVNPDSDLYRAHPDWVLSEPNRERLTVRTQLILDMSRDEIADWAIDWLERLVVDAKLDYLKWDMNREAAEIGLDQFERSVAVKYTRNLEQIWQHLNDRFPDLLFENCASGGGRADYGMLRYTDRVNRSDNSDPIDVMLLQENFTTLFVPKLAGGGGNISLSPHKLNGRTIPLDYRICMGMTGSLSVGINITKSDDAELDALRTAIAKFKNLRDDLQDSYVYRIVSARENRYSVLQYVRRDRKQFTMFAFGHGLHQWDKQFPRFKMRGLIPDGIYVSESGTRISGAGLMNSGIGVKLQGDYASHMETWHLEETGTLKEKL